MSKLSFELTRIDVPEKGNYFLLVQLDETEYPSKLTRTQKYRTEIDYSTEFPSFQKNYFVFNNVQLGNKLTFRIGLFTLTNVNGISQKYKKQICPQMSQKGQNRCVPKCPLILHRKINSFCNYIFHIFYKLINFFRSNH